MRNQTVETIKETDLKKKLDRSFIVLKSEARKLQSRHLTRTQKAAGPSVGSMRNHPAWIVKCKFKDF